jgi:gamma-glutamyltranspeptidase/glutathione hydrolase
MALLLALALSATAISSGGAVATAHPLASAAGAEVLRGGGNAADAAVAAALALSVVENQSSGIGGGGFALVWLARERRAVVLDFREVAPAAAAPDMFAADARDPTRRSLDGGLAVAVPGAVKGYAELARRFGSRPLAALAEPAARLAERGFTVGPSYAAKAAERRACLSARPAAAREFLAEGAAPPVGHRLVRRELARTLRAVGRDPEVFYRGPLAERIARAVRDAGGVLTAADLAAYRVVERAPLEGSYRGRRILTVPLPSSGGAILLGLLQGLEGEDPAAGGYRDERLLHRQVELSKRLFARRALLGDPAHAPGAAAVAAELADPRYATRLAAGIGERATPSEELGPAAAPVRGASAGEKHTSHVSVIDRDGNAVSLTTTVNYSFGSCVVVPGTGILLNDQMDDFDGAPGVPNAYGLVGTGANAPAPGKRPLSSMAPTVVLDPGGAAWVSVGAPGGSTIPTTVAQVVSHLVDDGMTLAAALAAPRIHHQWLPDELRVEPHGLEAATARALEARGHRITYTLRPWGDAQAVLRRADGRCEAASDPRWEGVPAAP